MIDRRQFIGSIMASAAGQIRLHSAFAQAVAAAPLLYYMDGYHGGVRGHMPPGCWRDILSALRQFPEWKLSFDVEPASWEVVRQEDPEAYAELRTYFADNGMRGRTEMVAATFAQPYGWAISGESNIRQLQRGLAVIREHFPHTDVVTYAVQEPCWASCLPQILRSLRFDGAVLKNASTAWGGYAAGFDADLVEWTGPDGTAITTVPRYAVERLQKVWETESIDGTREFAERCIAHGIPHPAGMCFQDLGWAAKPRVSGSYIRFATWREYIHAIADKPKKSWRFGIEDILVTLPWGDATLQKVAQEVRSAEVRLVVAEKIAAMAALECGMAWPAEQLVQAWDGVLLSQAHDAWITATTRSGRQAWAFQVAANTLASEDAAENMIANSLVQLGSGESSAQVPLGEQAVLVVNTLGFARSDLAELTLATDPSTTGIVVTDQHGTTVPAQVMVKRRYLPETVLKRLSEAREVAPGKGSEPTGASINTATVLIAAKAPSMGYASYHVKPLYGGKAEVPATHTFARSEAISIASKSIRRKAGRSRACS
jgi:alpha-mannosidase